jgi:hypothetical protein
VPEKTLIGNSAKLPHLDGDQDKQRCGVDREELGVLSRYPAAQRRLLTVDEYHRMGDAGILTEDDRVELIEGELVAMPPIGSEHIAAAPTLR